MADGPKVKRHAQPLGNAGIAHSLDEVSRKAIEGGRDEVVRAWATHVLKGCGFPKGALARARCFLADTRLYPWIPDPVDVEFIPSPRLMMPNVITGEGPMYLADDCDGLTARWLALCLAAGIRAQVVGYAFEKDLVISHVLGSVWDDIAGEWVDGDPSFQDMPLGKTQPHTWEQRRELPSMEIVCDDTACDIKKAPNDQEGIVDFVGVGKPASTVGVPGEIQTGNTDDPSWLPDLGKELSDLADNLTSNWSNFKTTYDAMRALFASHGLTDLAQLEKHGWSADDQQNAIDLGVMSTVAARYLNEAATGVRSIWAAPADLEAMKGTHDNLKTRCMATGGQFDEASFTAWQNNTGLATAEQEAALCACPAGTGFQFYNGCVPPGYKADVSWAIEKKPDDVFGIDLVDGKPVLVNAQGAPAHAPASNTVGLPPQVTAPVLITGAIAGAVIVVAATYAIIHLIEHYTSLAQSAACMYADSNTTKCREKDSGVSQADCEKRVAEHREWCLKLKPEPPKPAGDPLTGALSAVSGLAYAAGAVLTIYGIVRLVEAVTANKRTAKA
jgi:hypothetical protein